MSWIWLTTNGDEQWRDEEDAAFRIDAIIRVEPAGVGENAHSVVVMSSGERVSVRHSARDVVQWIAEDEFAIGLEAVPSK